MLIKMAAGKPPGSWQAAGENTTRTTKILVVTLHYPARGAVLARPITYNLRKWAKISIFKGLKNGDADAVAT